MNQRYRLLALLFFLAIGALLLLGNPTGSSQAAPNTPDDIDIVGGDPVPDPNPFVWQVKLYMTRADGKQAGCGGSVISERWILTAAHCVLMDSPVTKVDVIVGQRILGPDQTGSTFAVRRAEPHPHYDDVLLFNDIALLELESPIPNAERYIVPLMTQEREKALGQAGTIGIVTGWGYTIPKNNQSSPDLLRYANLLIAGQEACRTVWHEDTLILDSMLCAGTIGQEISACQGDSGGAFVVPDGRGSYIQNGIVSFGHKVCSNPNFYSVYTRVSHYIDWIEASTGIDFTTPRAPDLVIDDVYLNENQNLEIVIRNQGDARVALDQGFWVDLYVNPESAPTAVNQTWNHLGKTGAVWGIDRTGFVLLPGETETITLSDQYFWPTLSPLPIKVINGLRHYYLPVGTEFYIQIDSANANTDYGAILERHELFGGEYNNISPLYTVVDDPILVRASAEAIALPERVYLPLIVGNSNAATAATAEETTTQPSTLSTTTLPPRTPNLEAN